MTANRKRVLISGAGIAGLTAAYWFSKMEWEVVILEKAAMLRKGEFVIDFSGTGWDVAIEMGIADELRKRQTTITTLSFQDHLGKERASIKMDNFAQLMGVGDKIVSINRRDLQNLLHEMVESKVDIRYNSSVKALTEDENSVQVELEDGTQERYDLVVGADGLHSNIRNLVFGNEAKYSKYLGYYVSAFRVTGIPTKKSGIMEVLRQPNKQAGILDLGNGDALGLFLFASENEAYIAREQRKPMLLEIFADMQGAVPEVLHAISDETNIYMDTTTQIDMPQWHSKRVVLIGDAAYCLTLVSGQGASMAMGGAYVLAKAIENSLSDDVGDALATYDAKLRDFITELQKKSRRFASSFIPSSEIGLWATDKMVSWINNPIVKRFASSQFNVQSLFEREAKEKHHLMEH